MDKITYNFQNRTALITGGAQGFGLDIAKRFLNSGAKVIIWDIDHKMLKKAESELNRTDWYITRKSEKNTAIPSAITTHRDAVRSKQASMCTAITNASDTPALETLYTRNDDGERPLGELPTKDF